jgi:hypothetical protein
MSPIAPSDAGERAGRYLDGVYVFEAEVKTNPKTPLELANADDEDD